MSLSELHGVRTTDHETHPAASPMLSLIPYGTHGTLSYETPFDSTIPGERTYSSFGAFQGYQTSQEQTKPAPLPSSHCDEDPHISTAGTIEPFHFNPFPPDRPGTAFGYSGGAVGPLLETGPYYLDDNEIHPSAYRLDDGFHFLQQPRFPCTSPFETTQHGLYQTDFSHSGTPPGRSPSLIVPRSRIDDDALEDSPRADGGPTAREDLEEDDAGSDKPYARLIWEALMQAPGHRMMLREIYAWFLRNTNKARDSGSNGWQNSIRHNLSMNQAFENDKSDAPNSRGQAKKANSVWVLTENAIKGGVQSTTRYRKTGSGKKSHNSGTPAPLRQRSGARGGRAARRAAKLRRNEQDHFSEGLPFPGMPSPPHSYGSTALDGTANDADFVSIRTPTTPTNDLSYNFSAAFDIPNYAAEMPLFYSGEEDYPEHSRAPVQHEFVIQPAKPLCSDGIRQFPYGSNPHEVPM